MNKKYSYLFETLAGIAIILFINFMWFRSDMGFIGVSPHPLWIVVIFIAVRYGSFQGFVGGFLCGVALVLSVSYSMEIEQQFAFSDIPARQFRLAGLFVFFGFLVGEERSRINRFINKRMAKYNKLRNEFEALAMDRMALKNINTELQGRILSQADTLNTVYEAARELVTLKIDHLYPSVIRLVGKFIGPDKCSLYIYEDGKFLLKGSNGWGDEIRERAILSTSPDIFKKVLEEKRVVTVSDIFKSENLKWKEGKDPCMVSPLFFGDDPDVVMGLIVIDDIPFIKFNPDTVRFLSILSDWVSKSLDNAFATTTVRMTDIYNKELGIFNYNYGMRRLKEALVNAQAADVLSSVLLVKIGNYDELAEDKKIATLKSFLNILLKSLSHNFSTL